MLVLLLIVHCYSQVFLNFLLSEALKKINDDIESDENLVAHLLKTSSNLDIILKLLNRKTLAKQETNEILHVLGNVLRRYFLYTVKRWFVATPLHSYRIKEEGHIFSGSDGLPKKLLS